jgi:hypothetical protein
MGFRYGVSSPYDEEIRQGAEMGFSYGVYGQRLAHPHTTKTKTKTKTEDAFMWVVLLCEKCRLHHCEILYEDQEGRLRANGHPLRSTHVLANFE